MFVVVAAGLFLAGLIILSAGALARHAMIMETYLDESIHGLDVGSPIKLRGVKVGQVEKIMFVDEEYATEHRYVLIRFAILPHIARNIEMARLVPGLQKEIKTGLRLRMATQGLTGTSYLEADYMDPQRYPPLPIDWRPEYPYIPSVQSLITRLSDSTGTILRQVELARVDLLASNINVLVTTLSGLLQADVQPTLVSVQQASHDMAALIARLDHDLQNITQRDLPPLFENARLSSSNLVVTSERVKQVFKQIETLLESNQQQWEETLVNVQNTSSELRELIRNAKQYPAGMFFGEPPPAIKK